MAENGALWSVPIALQSLDVRPTAWEHFSVSKPDRRRSPRVSVWLRTNLRTDGRSVQVYTGEIGLRGAYIVTEIRHLPRQLVSASIVLPDGSEIDLNGMVIRTVSADAAARRGAPPGIGVQFYGLSRECKQRWEDMFFRILSDRSPRSSPEADDGVPEQASGLTARQATKKSPPSLVIVPEGAHVEAEADESPPSPIPLVQKQPAKKFPPPLPKRRHSSAPPPRAVQSETVDWSSWYKYFHGSDGAKGRESTELKWPPPPPSDHPAAASYEPPTTDASAPDNVNSPAMYRLALADVTAMRRAIDGAIEAGGLFVQGGKARPAGTPAVLCVVHPLCSDELHLPGEIVDVSPGDGRQGVSIAFNSLGDKSRKSFHRFVELGATADDPATRRAPETPQQCETATTARVTMMQPEESNDDDLAPRDTDAFLELSLDDVLVIEDDEI